MNTDWRQELPAHCDHPIGLVCATCTEQTIARLVNERRRLQAALAVAAVYWREYTEGEVESDYDRFWRTWLVNYREEIDGAIAWVEQEEGTC
jgi:hypothetical protein